MQKTLYAIPLMAAALTASWSAAQAQTENAAGSPTVTGIRNAATFPGPDIGAKINAAIDNLPDKCGEVLIPVGTYAQTTTIIKPRCIKLHGEGAFATILKWASTSGAAMVAADTRGEFDYPEGEISDLTIQGPGSSTSSGIGVFIGGDPAGALISKKGWGDHQNLNRVRILGFGTGVQWGNNTWSDTISQGLISSNGTGLYFPSGLSNSGESISIIGTSTQNNKQALNLVGFSDFYFFGSRCDYNVTCGSVNAAHFYGEHFEQGSGTILTIAGTSQPHVEIFGGLAVLTSSSGNDTQMFYVNSTLNPTFKLSGTYLMANHPVANIVNWHGTGGSPVLAIEDLPYYNPGLSLTNATCNFWGCRIEDGQGSLAFSGKHASLQENGAASFQSMTLADSSTALSRYAKYTATLSPAAVGANTCSAQDVPVKGVQPADVVLKAMKPAEQPGLALMGGRATAAGTVAIQFCNNTGAGITPTANEIYTFVVVQ